MAIVFTYTESTNIVVVTGGTSGTPAVFADFVTADRAGTDTDLLVSASPGAAVALTYAVRPVEDLAILVKCVVANKTAEADFIFITGKDWRGAAQTESIDVTAGNASYTTTKYWSEITTLDCSDNANGGGTVWADGDLSVTQDIWGAIWDYGNGQYKIDCYFGIGDDSTPTFFKSTNEMVDFASGNWPSNRINSTCQLGDLQGDWGVDGSMWTTRALNDARRLNHGTMNLYASMLKHYGDSTEVRFQTGTLNAKNSIFSSDNNQSGSWKNQFRFIGGTVNIENCFFNNIFAARFDTTPNIFSGNDFHYITFGIYANSDATVTKARITNIANFGYVSYQDNVDLVLVDPPEGVSSVIITAATGTIVEKYTINIHIADKDGTDLGTVNIVCDTSESSNYDTEEFDVNTDANGDITEQTITYKKWVGTSETLTDYSPTRFTISKAGYETLTLENITVDGPIDWHLELQDRIKISIDGNRYEALENQRIRKLN